ncbi:MAG: hypothetical protein GX410_00335 [Elusimicrobia bacterium]|nr:hypothetical protein [Elusimicrobiota bacterium]
MEKKIGYAVFLSGVGFVLYALHAVGGVFSGAVPPPKIIAISSLNIPLAGNWMELPVPNDVNTMCNIALRVVYCSFISLTGWLLGLLGVGMVKAGNVKNPARPEAPPAQK